jgi:hypothetical protein
MVQLQNRRPTMKRLEAHAASLAWSVTGSPIVLPARP